jgi:5-formyltetrahydrofolate cyclo-ligase
MDKKELRAFFMQKRRSMSDELRIKESQSIIQQIRVDSRYKESRVIALFYPMIFEVNLLSLLEDSKTFVFPRVEKDGIHFYPFSKKMVWHKSPFGVMEPEGNEIMDDIIDLMITPALAISKDLYRLGYGKGYYDQFLTKHRPKHVIGVIFSHEWVETLPKSSHDQILDDVIKGSL